MIRRWQAGTVALLLLSAASCTTQKSPSPNTPAERNIAQVASRFHLSPGGETIPPPEDVGGREKPAASSEDKTLVLMADIATAQDKIQAHLKKIDEQWVAFVRPASEQIAEIKQTRLPELEKKIGWVQHQIAAANEQLNARMTRQEQHFVSPIAEPVAASPEKVEKTPAPAAATLPVAAALASTEAPAAKTQPTAGILDKYLDAANHTKKPMAKVNPVNQELRDYVRDAYNKVITCYPTTDAALEAYLGLAGLAEQDRDWPAASQFYRQALERFPNAASAADVRFGLAKSLQERGEWDEARKHFLSIADEFPRHQKTPMALVNAADCLAKLGKSSDALKEFQAIEHSQQNTPMARVATERIGDLLCAEKKFKDAAAAYLRASNGDDPIPAVILKLARCQVATGEFGSARESLRRLLGQGTSDDTRATAQFAIASTYEEEGDFLNAAREFASAADKFPADSGALEARMKCAQLFLSLEMPDHAVAQCEQLLGALKESSYSTRAALEPQALHAAVKGSRLASNTEKLQGRLAQLRREWPDSPQTQAAEIDEADNLEQAGKGSEAIAALRELVRRQPNTPLAAQAILKIAELQDRSKNSKRGISIYGELASLTSNTDHAAQLKLRRALLLEEAGRDDEALALLKSIAADAGNSQAALGMAEYQMALIDQKRGRLDDAVNSYEKLIAREKDLPNGQLGDLLEDAHWKISKLKWLSNLQKQQELTVQPEPAKAPQAPGKRS